MGGRSGRGALAEINFMLEAFFKSYFSFEWVSEKDYSFFQYRSVVALPLLNKYGEGL